MNWDFDDIIRVANKYDIPLTFEQAMLILDSVSSCAIENIHVSEEGLARVMYETTAGNRVTLSGGSNMIRVHDENDECRNEGCAIHNPTDHAMKDFPQVWNNDARQMERVCPCKVHHPDPDHIAWVARKYGKKAIPRANDHICCKKHCCET